MDATKSCGMGVGSEMLRIPIWLCKIYSIILITRHTAAHSLWCDLRKVNWLGGGVAVAAARQQDSPTGAGHERPTCDGIAAAQTRTRRDPHSAFPPSPRGTPPGTASTIVRASYLGVDERSRMRTPSRRRPGKGATPRAGRAAVLSCATCSDRRMTRGKHFLFHWHCPKWFDPRDNWRCLRKQISLKETFEQLCYQNDYRDHPHQNLHFLQFLAEAIKRHNFDQGNLWSRRHLHLHKTKMIDAMYWLAHLLEEDTVASLRCRLPTCRYRSHQTFQPGIGKESCQEGSQGTQKGVPDFN